jgi:hypothetical protein
MSCCSQLTQSPSAWHGAMDGVAQPSQMMPAHKLYADGVRQLLGEYVVDVAMMWLDIISVGVQVLIYIRSWRDELGCGGGVALVQGSLVVEMHLA